MNVILNVVYIIISIALYEMGSGGPLCTIGFFIERHGDSYAHMALQVVHCLF